MRLFKTPSGTWLNLTLFPVLTVRMTLNDSGQKKLYVAVAITADGGFYEMSELYENKLEAHQRLDEIIRLAKYLPGP